jgi:hypothetical protein
MPFFEKRVSPHFLTAPELLLVQVDGGIACSTLDDLIVLRQCRLFADRTIIVEKPKEENIVPA